MTSVLLAKLICRDGNGKMEERVCVINCMLF